MHFRRASFVSALSLALAAIVPAPASAQGAGRGAGPADWAVLVGIEDGPGSTGLQLRGDLEFPMQRLAPEVGFSIVGQIGFSRFSESQSYYSGYLGYQDKWESSLNLLKFGGTARFSFGHMAIRPYADAGLGIYYAGASNTQTVYGGPYTGYITDKTSASDVSLFMHLAAGATFPVNPRFSLGLELGFNPYFGDVDETLTSLLASATFRM